MKLKQSPSKAARTPSVASQELTIRKEPASDLLRRLGHAGLQSGESLQRPNGIQAPPTLPSIIEQWNAAVGCKTSEVALELLAQIVRLDHPNVETMSDEYTNTLLMKATAMVAELQPRTATEAMLAAQMVGAHRVAMTFLAEATKREDTVEGRDRNTLRALRLMRLFAEQVDAMAKLKGKSGQQHVVVEHVNVNAGGQAIVGTVIPGG